MIESLPARASPRRRNSTSSSADGCTGPAVEKSRNTGRRPAELIGADRATMLPAAAGRHIS